MLSYAIKTVDEKQHGICHTNIEAIQLTEIVFIN